MKYNTYRRCMIAFSDRLVRLEKNSDYEKERKRYRKFTREFIRELYRFIPKKTGNKLK